MSYLDRTKEWFKRTFGRELDEGKWEEIDFTEIVQDFLEFIGDIVDVFGREGFELRRKNKMEEDGVIYFTLDHISDLYKHLQSGEQENLQETKQYSSQLEVVFGNKYQGPALKYFEEHVNKCSEEWKQNREKWHAPYFAVVQSSGYGKSRMCKEFACTNLEWWTIYVCLRKENSTGYPPRHQHAVELLKDIAKHSARTSEPLIILMAKWIKAWKWVRAVCHYVLSLHDTRQHLSESMFMDYVSYLVDQLKKESNDKQEKREKDKKQEESANNSTQAKKPKMQESVRIKILEACKCIGTQKWLSELSQSQLSLENCERQYFWKLCEKAKTADQLHQFVKRLWLLKNDSLLFQTRVPVKTLFILDEARFLIQTKTEKVEDYTLFRVFRGALKVTEGTFAVLVDTTSRISSLAPPWFPASRLIPSDNGGPGKALLPPFNCVTTADVLNTFPYAFGRPLWGTTLQCHSLEAGLRILKEFAWDKITCYKHGYSTTVVIAMLSILTGISISPISNTVMDLVGSHMATCWAIDENREAMFVSYPVEPILAEAVLDKVRHFSEHELMTNLLDPLSCQLRLGVVNLGHSGEFVVKFLFLLARCKSSKAFENCTVSNWMEAMFGKPMFDLFQPEWTKEKTENVGKGEISFTCFSKVMRWDKSLKELWAHENPEAILKAFFERRAAMEFPDHRRGADFLVPVRLDRNKYKYILIQAKNVLTTFSHEPRDKLTPENVFDPNSNWIHYDIGFHMLINVASPPPQPQDNVTFDGKILEVVRIDAFSNLQLQVKNGLQRILREKSVEQWVDEKEKAKVLNFDTLWRAVYALEESHHEDGASAIND